MPDNLVFAHGQFAWVDLAAHDVAGIRTFYEELFGWTTKDVDTQGAPSYAQFYLNGKRVGGLGQMPEEMKAQGIPPVWSTYINVDDIHQTVQKATELGGKVTMPVMQIFDYGWMTFILDPTGGHVGLWQKNTHGGAEILNVPGTFCWNELATRDMDKAVKFYADLVGWTYDDNPTTNHPYKIINCGGRQIGGIIQMDENWPKDMPPSWMVYFTVADIDRSAQKLTELGGTICVPVFDIPVGRMSVVSDPQGGTFTLIQLNPGHMK